MEFKHTAEEAAFNKRVEKGLMGFAEKAPTEAFKWLGWASAIAAIQVVHIRTHSPWLQWLSVCLSLLLILRIQWFVSLRHPEETKPDGSVVTKFAWWRLLISVPVTVAAWWVAFALPVTIASSDLLPPVRETPAAVEPQALPQAADEPPRQPTGSAKQP